jgi:hypothetical protein
VAETGVTGAAVPPPAGAATADGGLAVPPPVGVVVPVLAGARAKTVGVRPTEPICAVPVELLADCGPEDVLPEPAEADPIWTVPVDWLADWVPPPAVPVPPPELMLGPALAVGPPPVPALTGADALASGEAFAVPTWAVPVDSLADCGPEDALPEPADADPTWTVPVDWSADWVPPPAVPVPPPELMLGSALTVGPPFVSALSGADAVVSGETFADPTWTVPVDPSADCGPEDMLPEPADADPIWTVPVDWSADWSPPPAVPVPPLELTLGAALTAAPLSVPALTCAEALVSGEALAEPT